MQEQWWAKIILWSFAKEVFHAYISTLLAGGKREAVHDEEEAQDNFIEEGERNMTDNRFSKAKTKRPKASKAIGTPVAGELEVPEMQWELDWHEQCLVLYACSLISAWPVYLFLSSARGASRHVKRCFAFSVSKGSFSPQPDTTFGFSFKYLWSFSRFIFYYVILS